MNIFPTAVFLSQSGENNQTTKTVNLSNISKMPAQYHVQYDWMNCPIKCHPSFGVVEKYIQIKLELKPHLTGYYYKRLYILIENHVRLYLVTYGFE